MGETNEETLLYIGADFSVCYLESCPKIPAEAERKVHKRQGRDKANSSAAAAARRLDLDLDVIFLLTFSKSVLRSPGGRAMKRLKSLSSGPPEVVGGVVGEAFAFACFRVLAISINQN